MDPRVSLNLMVFADALLEDAIGFAREIGVQRIGVPNWTLEAAGWNRGLDLIRDCGMTVSTIIHPSMFQLDDEVGWEQSRALLIRSLEAAATVGAETVYTTTGPAGRLTWEEAAAALTEAVAPVVEFAVSIGVPLLIETTNPLRIPASFVHQLADAALLAERTGLGLCVDIYACWTERALQRTIERAVERIHLVQVSDFVAGTLDMPNRAVPGDGDIPLQRIIAGVLGAGYAGAFDLELLGPRIDAEGHVAAARRSAERLSYFLASASAAVPGAAGSP